MAARPGRVIEEGTHEALLARGAGRVLVTDGGRMAAEATQGAGVITGQPPQVLVTRVTGAGDTFMAAHIVAERRGDAQEAALTAALRAAADGLGWSILVRKQSGDAFASIADLRRLFDGIPLDRVTTSMTINATAPILLALYVAVAEENGVPRAALGGTVQNDLLKEYIARGTYIFPPAPSLRLITDVVEWSSAELPKWNTISISGNHMREAGATAAQELAFTFANAIAYVEAAVARGMQVDAIAPRLSFFFAAWTDILEETGGDGQEVEGLRKEIAAMASDEDRGQT